jgi:glycine/D-amino acid oxidase-like deaminating enzyme
LPDNFILKRLGFQDSTDASKEEIPELQAIDARLQVHQADRNQQGLIARGVDWALSTVWHSDQDSEKALQSLRAEVVAAQHSGDPNAVKKLDRQVEQAVDNDQKAVQGSSFKSGTSNFIGDVAVAAPLFIRGSKGRSLSALTNSVNDITPSDGLGGMVADATMGAAKGYALSLTFEKMGKMRMSVAKRGTVLGVLNRTETNLLTARNYRDQNGQIDIGQGLGAAALNALNPAALATDVAGGLASRSLAGALDGRFNGILSKNPLAANMFTGGTVGLISGGSGEIQNESRTGNYSFQNILESSLRGAGSSTISAAIGRGMERTSAFAPSQSLFTRGTPASDSIMLPHRDVKPPVGNEAPVVTTNAPTEKAPVVTANSLADEAPLVVPTAAELGTPVPLTAVKINLKARPIESVTRPETDVAVIGNGIIGLTLANRLAQGRFALGNGELRPRVTVLSASDLAQEGNSHQMTGMATRAIDGPYQKFLDNMGPENFAKFIEAVRTGQLHIQDLAKQVGVFRPSNSYYFAYEPNDEYLRVALAPLATADSRNSYLFGDTARKVQPWMAEAIKLTDEGNVDPSQLLMGIASQKAFSDRVQMLRGMVTAVQTDNNGVTVETADGSTLRTKMAVFATNRPPSFLGNYSHTYEDWEGLTLVANAPGHNLGPNNYFDTETVAFFRSLGGDTVSIGGDAETLVPLRVMNRLFPNAEIIHATASTLPISNDQLPAFDRIPGMHGRVFFAGLGSGTGLVFSGVATDVIPKLLDGQDHPAPELWGLDRFENNVHIETH